MTIAFALILRSSLVLTVGLAARWALRKQPAVLRHWVLVSAIALAAAQPLINRVMPSWHIGSFDWSRGDVAAGPGVQMDLAFSIERARPAPPAVQPVNWQRLAYQVWLAGTTLSLAVLLAAASWLWRLGAGAPDAGEPWQRAADEIRRRAGVRSPIRIAITRQPALLVTWGVLRPVILLPRDAAAWTSDRIELVLAHEIAHLVRRDWLIQLLSEGLRAINWFNPLFWIACSRLRQESEYACDDMVLDLGIGGTSYASHLVELARSFSVHGRTWLPAPSMARPSTLERRVRAMLNPQVNRRPVSRVRRGAVALLLLGLTLPIAAAAQAVTTPSGIVSDPSGRPLADVSLKLSSLSDAAAYETRSDGAGGFQFSPVPAGEYMLAARSTGFSSLRQRLVLSGGAMQLPLRMQIGTLQETISVRSGAGSGADNAKRYEETVAGLGAPYCEPSATGGRLSPPMKLHDVRPRYKAEWAAAALEGVILMQASIGTDGRVRSVEIVSPVNEDLEDEAIAAVSQWVFSPTYLNCQPVEVRMFVTVSFKIDR